MDETRLNCRIDRDLRERFKIAVIRQHTTIAKVITELIIAWLAQAERQAQARAEGGEAGEHK